RLICTDSLTRTAVAFLLLFCRSCRLVEFCKRIAPEARARRLTIAIEPQRRQEYNIIDSVAEALVLVTAVNDPAIQIMVDFYHLSEEREDTALIVKAGK